MVDNRLYSLLGLCRKARKASFGHDAALSAVLNRTACLVLLSADASERLEQEFRRIKPERGKEIPVIRTQITMQDFAKATGLKSAVVSVNESGFAETIQKLLNSSVEENI